MSAATDRATLLTVEREASRDAMANLVAAEAALTTAITLGQLAGWGDILQDLQVTAEHLRWAIRDVQP